MKKNRAKCLPAVSIGNFGSQNSIECKAFFWYPIGKGDIDFKFVYRATTSFFEIALFKGRSPSFIFMSTFSRHFGTNSKNKFI